MVFSLKVRKRGHIIYKRHSLVVLLGWSIWPLLSTGEPSTCRLLASVVRVYCIRGRAHLHIYSIIITTIYIVSNDIVRGSFIWDILCLWFIVFFLLKWLRTHHIFGLYQIIRAESSIFLGDILIVTGSLSWGLLVYYIATHISSNVKLASVDCQGWVLDGVMVADGDKIALGVSVVGRSDLLN